jgi:hypothetical protein
MVAGGYPPDAQSDPTNIWAEDINGDAKGTVTQLNLSTPEGKILFIEIAHAGGGAAAFPSNETFFRDVDHDGVDELVIVNLDSKGVDGGGNYITTLTSLEVCKWSGSFFEYSKTFSDKLKTNFDLTRDIPY